MFCDELGYKDLPRFLSTGKLSPGDARDIRFFLVFPAVVTIPDTRIVTSRTVSALFQSIHLVGDVDADGAVDVPRVISTTHILLRVGKQCMIRDNTNDNIPVRSQRGGVADWRQGWKELQMTQHKTGNPQPIVLKVSDENARSVLVWLVLLLLHVQLDHESGQEPEKPRMRAQCNPPCPHFPTLQFVLPLAFRQARDDLHTILTLAKRQTNADPVAQGTFGRGGMFSAVATIGTLKKMVQFYDNRTVAPPGGASAASSIMTEQLPETKKMMANANHAPTITGWLYVLTNKGRSLDTSGYRLELVTVVWLMRSGQSEPVVPGAPWIRVGEGLGLQALPGRCGLRM